MADPGFPGVGMQTPKVGVKSHYLVNFSEKCMKIKEIGPRGCASLRAPLPRALDPPMRMVERGYWSGGVGGAMRYERRQIRQLPLPIGKITL